MELYAEAKMPTKYGDFKILTFVNKITKSHHIVLIKGGGCTVAAGKFAVN